MKILEQEVFSQTMRPDNSFGPEAGEHNSGEILVEIGSYVPLEAQINDMILAGERLAEYRASEFDIPPGEEIPEDYLNPLHKWDFDVIDAAKFGNALQEKMRKEQAAAKARIAAEEAAKNAPADKGKPPAAESAAEKEL